MPIEFVKTCLQKLSPFGKARRRSRPHRPNIAKIDCNPRTEAILRATDLGLLLDRSVDSIGEYNLTHIVGNKPSNRLIGIEVWTWGRFANALLANINAISAADRLGLQCVVLCEAEGYVTDKMLDYKGIKLYSSKSLLRAGGWLLRGPFWDHVGGWSPLQPGEQRLIARSVIRCFLVQPDPPARHARDELAVHIRGGDVFGDDVNSFYVQPPLAFYRRAVRIASTLYGVKRVRIVAEDRLNPCVAGLEDHLRERGIPFVYQSLTLIEDFASLLDVEHFAFGFGTFGPAVCLMSDGIKNVFYFLANPSLEPDSYPWIRGSHVLYDSVGAYIKQGEWRNDETQRRQMLEYPDDAVAEKRPIQSN